MEELYQKYKDRVNFLWAYGREAHPEERPFAAGFETKDLGWDHRYFEPTTMEERAQRARWMKTDLEPDLEIPIIIDYINSPLGENNAIWNVYRGGGFYSGFVIDCDGTVLIQENWAWFAPGGQWWSLPLERVENIEVFLDSYLADPPPCYNSGSTPTGLPAQPTQEIVAGADEGLPTVLIVDDDGGSSYEGYFKIPLGNLKKHFQVWDVQESGSPPSDILVNYEAVVWFTGDASQDTLTSIDQTNLAVFLDGGGKLFLSGQHTGQDIGDTPFYRDYLHATLIEDDTNISWLSGEDILSGIEITISGNDGAGNQEVPSQIGLLDSAVGIFRYDTLVLPAWGGLRWGGDYKVVYLAFGFEGIGDRGAGAFRYKILKEVFAWFEGLESDTTTTTMQSTTTVTGSTTTTIGTHDGKVDDALCLTCHDISFTDEGLHGIHFDNDCTDCHEIVGDSPLASRCASCHPAADSGRCMLVLHHEDSTDYAPSGLSCLGCHSECSGEASSTTTSIECPLLEIYGEDSQETELLRFIRDKVLHKSPEGQEIIRVYYEWSPAIVREMEADTEFKKKVRGLIDGVLPLILEEE